MRIVIIGAGFGGIYTCKNLLNKLKNRAGMEIVLINNSNYFVFTPLLHEIATGGLNLHSAIKPIREILITKNFRFIKGEAENIDFQMRKIFLKDLSSVDYDYLVISIGAKANFFDIPGAEKYSFSLKSVEGALKIKKKIITSLENSINLNDKNKIKELLTFVIVGGGTTGVELAAEIHEFLFQALELNYNFDKSLIKVIILQKEPKLMPNLDDSCASLARKRLLKKGIEIRFNSSVTKVLEDSVIVNNKEAIKTRNIIWTAGVTPNFVETRPRVVNERNYYLVDNYLRVVGLENVFSLGDCALFYDEEKKEYAPALAQVAVKQAKVVSYNIISLLNNKELIGYKLRLSGFLVSVGRGFAITHLFGIHFTGKIAWFLWRTIYFLKIIGLKNKIRVGFEWALNLFFGRDTNEI